MRPDETYPTARLPAASLATIINETCRLLHDYNLDKGWWEYYFGGNGSKSKDAAHEVGAKMALIHSEISEALEGFRRSENDSHIPTRPAVEVELADACIRIFDLAGRLGLDLGGAIVEKQLYNEIRADHMLEVRAGANGKLF